MKILELRFKNLNSLYGEWILDFTDPEFIANGIFALTGPTGAGKSTILDALCLALYGMTPRLGKITKSGNDIMSRQTGECYAEVLFESREGRFRCHWEQRRARKSADGKLQDQEHQIAEGDSGRLIETKKSLVLKVIEEKTGMDFDRFTRSVLLAQGSFDTFLKADLEEKSRLLEQITGTEIYSEISRRVHERLREEKEALSFLQAESSLITVLEPEEVEELTQELGKRQKEYARLTEKNTETAGAVAWLNRLDELRKEIQVLDIESESLRNRADAFIPERRKLEQALKAASLEGSYAALSALRSQQEQDLSDLEKAESALPDLEKNAESQAEALKNAEESTTKTKAATRDAAPLIQNVRTLDQRLLELKKTVVAASEQCEREASAIEAEQRRRDIEESKKTQSEKTLNAVEIYLRENGRDEWLVSGLAGIEGQFAALIARQEETEGRKRDLEKAGRTLGEAEKKLEESRRGSGICRQNLKEAEKKEKSGKDAYLKVLEGKALREYRAEKDALLREMSLLKRIEELESLRAKLEDGKPCPLCGSEDHPYARGNIPVPDDIEKKIASLTELITRAEDLEASNRELEKAVNTARLRLNDCEKQEAAAANEQAVAQRSRKELFESLKTLESGFSEMKEAASRKLRPLGIQDISESRIGTLQQSLRDRQKSWIEKAGEKTDLERQVAGIDSEVKRLDAVIETRRSAYKIKKGELDALGKELLLVKEERQSLFGEKNPDREEARWQSALLDAEEEEKRIREGNIAILEKLTMARTNLDTLKSRTKRRAPDLDRENTRFSGQLETVGFGNEREFLSAMMTEQERAVLTAQVKELDEARTELRAKLEDRKVRLEEERSKKVTGETRESLQNLLEETGKTLNTLGDGVAGIKHKLKENADARERMTSRLEAMEIQRKETLRWEKTS